MGLEVGSYITDLVLTNPTGLDPKSQGDDHLRLIKKTVQQSFPNINAPVTATPAQLNQLAALDFPLPLVIGNYLRASAIDALEERTPAQVLGDIGAAPLAHTHSGADITSGTIADARLSANVALLNAAFNVWTGQQRFDPGTVALPGISFAGDTDTGMYRIAPNIYALAAFGKLLIKIDGSTANDLIDVGDGTRAAFLQINGAAGSTRAIRGLSAGLLRWDMRLGNSGAEGGADSGSDFNLTRYTDGGVAIAAAFEISRANGQWSMGSNTLNTPAVPAMAWHGDLDTGIYRPAANQFGIAVGSLKGVELTSAGVVSGMIEGGTYTPTYTPGANCAGAGGTSAMMYMRVGSVVQVSGRMSLDPTAANLLTEATITLPVVGNNFTSADNASGILADPTSAAANNNETGVVTAVIGTTTVKVSITSINGAPSRQCQISFMYRVMP